jgi:anti-sigma regulatory factor (Ser/Thr protein kinase)
LQHGVQAPARARWWLAELCHAWGCEELAWDAGVLVSELTTNVVLHAGTDCRVGATLTDLALTVTVGDEMSGDLSVDDGRPTGQAGRGLSIVRALADAWGVIPTPTGKIVWFALCATASAESGGLRGAHGWRGTHRRCLTSSPTDSKVVSAVALEGA